MIRVFNLNDEEPPAPLVWPEAKKPWTDKKGTAEDFVPVITHPSGRHWEQPALHEFRMDADAAYMSLTTLERLLEYSCSQPSGVYPGKMWRIDRWAYSRAKYPDPKDRHVLAWYGNSDSEPDKYCSNHYRRIVIIEI